MLGERLRNTQYTRIAHGLEQDSINQPLPTLPGIDSLVAGRFDEAERHFQQVSRSERGSVVNNFLQAYAKAAADTEYKDVKEACSPKPGSFADHEDLVRYRTGELADLLVRVDDALPAPQRRVLELCLISSQSLETPDASNALESINPKLDSDTSEWTLDQKYWLAYLALKTHINSTEAKDKVPPKRLTEVEKLLSEVIRHVPLAQADLAFGELTDLCSKPSAGAWCVQMLTGLANLRRDSYWIPIGVAFSLSQLNRDSAALALQFLARAEGNLGGVEKNRQQEQRAWLAFTRGLAHQTLADFGVEDEIDRAIQIFEGLTTSKSRKVKNGPGTDLTYGALAGALFRKADTNGAAAAIKIGLKDTPESAFLLEQQAKLFELDGQFDEAVEYFKGKSDEVALFIRCLSRMFGRKTNDAEALEALKKDMDEFLSTSHGFRDYLRLIYYWTLMREGKSDDARKLLEDRWQEIKPSSWKVRLEPERGDYMTVWREKLVGYYLGKVPEKEISDIVEDAARFEASPFNKAEMSRKGFLCEWYLYDALLQSLAGDPNTRRDRLLERLMKAVNTKQVAFHEYGVAKALLKRIDEGEDFTLQAPAGARLDKVASQPE